MFIVYSYRSNTNIVVYIEGLYKTKDEAIKRQLDICGYKAEINMYTIKGNNYTTFKQEIPEGDCHIEKFT